MVYQWSDVRVDQSNCLGIHRDLGLCWTNYKNINDNGPVLHVSPPPPVTIAGDIAAEHYWMLWVRCGTVHSSFALVLQSTDKYSAIQTCWTGTKIYDEDIKTLVKTCCMVYGLRSSRFTRNCMYLFRLSGTWLLVVKWLPTVLVFGAHCYWQCQANLLPTNMLAIQCCDSHDLCNLELNPGSHPGNIKASSRCVLCKPAWVVTPVHDRLNWTYILTTIALYIWQKYHVS